MALCFDKVIRGKPDEPADKSFTPVPGQLGPDIQIAKPILGERLRPNWNILRSSVRDDGSAEVEDGVIDIFRCRWKHEISASGDEPGLLDVGFGHWWWTVSPGHNGKLPILMFGRVHREPAFSEWYRLKDVPEGDVVE